VLQVAPQALQHQSKHNSRVEYLQLEPRHMPQHKWQRMRRNLQHK
jgi:hypothetical protein